MVQQVNVGNEIHEFPDEATPDMIQEALSGEIAASKPSPVEGFLKRFQASGRQPTDKLIEDAWNLTKNLAGTATQGVPSLLSVGSNDPMRASKNLFAGIMPGIPIDMLNFALSRPQYLTHLISDPASDWMKKYTPEIPKEKILNKMLGTPEPTQEERNIRNLGGLLQLVRPGVKAATKVGAPIVKGIIGQTLGKTDPVIAAEKAVLEAKKSGTEADIEKATQAHEEAKAASEEAVSQSKQDIKKSDPDLMIADLRNLKDKLGISEDDLTNLKQQLTETKPQEGALSKADTKIREAKEAQQMAAHEAASATDTYKAAIEQSKDEAGRSADLPLMRNAARKRQDEIADLNTKIDTTQQVLTKTKPEESALPKAEENLNQANEVHEKSQNLLNDVKNNLDQYFDKDATHDVDISKGIAREANKIWAKWPTEYKAFLESVEDAKFQLPKTAMNKLDYSKMTEPQLIQTFGHAALEAMSKGKIDEFIKKQTEKTISDAKNPYLERLIKVAPTAKDTDAAAFIGKYKDFNSRLFDLTQEYKNPNLLYENRLKLEEALQKAREMRNQMKKVLEEGLGGFKKEFERVNKGYREEFYPLKENPVVDKAVANKLGTNVMKDLRTNEEGMPLVRKIVKDNPDIVKNVVAQKYFSKPKSIHNPNRMTKEYLDQLPAAKQMLNEHKQATQALEQAKNNRDLAEQQHEEISDRQVKAQKMESDLGGLHKDMEAAKDNLSKLKSNIDKLTEKSKSKDLSLKNKLSVEKQLKDAKAEHKGLAARYKEAEGLEDKISKHTDDINEYRVEIPKLESHIKNIQEKSSREDTTLEEKTKLQKELKQVNKQLSATKSKLSDSTTRLRKAWLIIKGLRKVARMGL